MNDQQLYERLKNIDLGGNSDDYFRSLDSRFGRGRQDAIDFLARMRDQDPVEIAKKQQAKAEQDRIALEAAQKAQEEDYLGRYTAKIAGQEKLGDAASRIGGELNLPNLRNSSNALTATLKATPQTQTTATRGYNVNSNQLARIIASKQAQLAPVAQEAITQTQNAESELGTRLGYLTAEQSKELQPIITEGSMLSERLARQFSGFTQEKQNELSLIMAQIQNQAQLTRDQLSYANELAKLKYQYDNTKADATKYLTVSEGSTVYDPVSGKALYTAPKTYKASTTGLSTDGWS